MYQRLTRFWGLLYVINYLLGIASGVVMEFQFGLNWSGLTKYLGKIAYGLLPTADAVSPASGSTMLASYIAFTALLGLLAIADWVLLAKYANRGPDVDLGRPPEVATTPRVPVLIGD